MRAEILAARLRAAPTTELLARAAKHLERATAHIHAAQRLQAAAVRELPRPSLVLVAGGAS